MKKINIIITIVALALLVGSCETYDDYNTDRKTVVGFPEGSRNINGVPTGSEKSIDVTVFASDVAATDRQFNIIAVPTILDNSTVPPEVETNPDNYRFDPTVTIPANSREGMLTVYGTNASMVQEKEFFSLAIEGSATVVSGAVLKIRLRQ
ncbi:hypothetical protein POV26_08150 [Aequorivita todarodis]|uniref:hypothetical protein n=1 Tax=Aequorivita todarodis TaxID=2036821 RepID=UPI002350C1B0|nr:hypothetical protein [Aequorivita todarodis]MDC8001006.1 hypothetical protein [Aequorivita todarodis]